MAGKSHAARWLPLAVACTCLVAGSLSADRRAIDSPKRPNHGERFAAVFASARQSPQYRNGKIAFVRLRPFRGTGPNEPTDLWTIRPDGMRLTRLTSGRPLDESPDFSHHGTRIAFDRTFSRYGGPSSIYVMKSDGTRLRRLTHCRLSVCLYDRDPTWSPSGWRIAFVHVTEHRNALQVMRADGTTRRTLRGFAEVDEPAWSPDGSRIAFGAFRKGGSAFALYEVAPNGSHLRKLTDFHRPGENCDSGECDNIDPAWSPDGEHIAVVHGADVYVMDADGTRIHRLVRCCHLTRSPEWSPNGRWIAFDRQTSRRDRELYVIRPDGTDMRRLTNGRLESYSPTWQPRPRAIRRPAAGHRTTRFEPTFVGFWDSRRGVAGGLLCRHRCHGAIKSSSDGGRTWHFTFRTRRGICSGTAGPLATAWAVTDDRSGCGNRMFRSSDYGETWTGVGRSRATSPTFLTEETGYAAGGPHRGHLLLTRDGGRTWRSLGAPCRLGPRWVAGASFTGEADGWAYCAGEGGMGEEPKAVEATSDGGEHWLTVAAATDPPGRRGVFGGLGFSGYPVGIAMLPNGVGWLWNTVAPYYLMRTIDGGRSWSPLPGFGQPWIVGVESAALLSETQGYVLVDTAAGVQLRFTRDGGATWLKSHTWRRPG